jgi:hypothetical protein
MLIRLVLAPRAVEVVNKGEAADDAPIESQPAITNFHPRAQKLAHTLCL